MLEAVIASLRQLYLGDERPWMVGFSGSNDSSLVAHLIFVKRGVE
jgi:PP-loop superfamily ATP-utilizing enzyme